MMSDVAQGPDWWLASDGKWYPPALLLDVTETESGAHIYTGEAAPIVRRSSEEEASLFRRYLGFEPELGLQVAIRPELREPLRKGTSDRSPARRPRVSERASQGGPAGPQPLGDAPSGDPADAELEAWNAWEASKDELEESEPRGPKHAKGRRWLR